MVNLKKGTTLAGNTILTVGTPADVLDTLKQAQEHLAAEGRAGLMSGPDYSKLASVAEGAQRNADITKTEIEAVLTGSISSHSHSVVNSALVANGTGTFTNDTTTQTFTDVFCDAASTVIVVITAGTTLGEWSVDSAAGSFTITSTVAESADISFTYTIIKPA